MQDKPPKKLTVTAFRTIRNEKVEEKALVPPPLGNLGQS